MEQIRHTGKTLMIAELEKSALEPVAEGTVIEFVAERINRSLTMSRTN